MQRLALEVMFVALASLWLAGCASWSSPPATTSTVARSAAPTRYEATVNNYFDLTMPPQATPRKLSIGAPEGSPCALHGTGGRHAGWVVPVIYDTTPPAQPTTSAMPQRGVPTAKGSNDKSSDKNSKTATASAATTQPLKSSTSGTPAASNGAPTTSLKEVNIRGTRYFFWFSSETLAAVSRDSDTCP